MMRYAYLFLLILLVACNQIEGSAHSGANMSNENDQGTVYYFDFEIERITGIPESQIEEYGSIFTINKNYFEKCLLFDIDTAKSTNYNKLDVRAKIVFSDRVYFVDHSGIVNTGNRYAMLNKKQFVRYLIKPLKQKNRQ